MRAARQVLLLFSLVYVSACIGASRLTPGPHRQRIALADSALRAELVDLGRRDQALREEIEALLDPSGSQRADSVALARLTVQLDSADRAHAARIRELVQKHGWPARAQVGGEGQEAVFLIVQHASHDVDLQRQFLRHLEATFRPGDRQTGEAIALLTDRMRVSQGKPQLYGTQFVVEGEKVILNPIEDEANVDERRSRLGLEPIGEYLRRLNQAFGVK
jgi:hypothetical protein